MKRTELTLRQASYGYEVTRVKLSSPKKLTSFDQLAQVSQIEVVYATLDRIDAKRWIHRMATA